MNILLTGGTGFIGSHLAVVLIDAGFKVVLFDNLSNSHVVTVNRLKEITGQFIVFVEGDVRDTKLLSKTIRRYKIDTVIHLAGLKAVGESTEKPFKYFNNNVGGTISLLQAMQENHLKAIVFSSSATVYGKPQYFPIDEDHPTSSTNPYGRSKLHIEEMLLDLTLADPSWNIICLRYFNPAGAHNSGLLGENPIDNPNNIVPLISQVAAGLRPKVYVFGDDYATPDGTGVRDYIHVMDLAEGHLAAVKSLRSRSGWNAINLGTGVGSSVLELIKQFALSSGKSIPYEILDRRSGDVDSCFASVEKAADLLRWKAKRNLESICLSAWKWQQSLK